jgi:hypothetical protein
MTFRLLLAALVLATACDRPVEVAPGYQLMVDSPLEPIRDLDILFVVDDSGAMGDEQEALAVTFGRFIDRLDSELGGRPNLHLAVTSTNVGTGPDGGGGDACSGQGDNGVFQVGDECPALDQPFLIDLADPDDPSAPRTINYPEGQLAETFSCRAQLGASGCGFEQQLEAMRRALDGSNPENAGFLRRDAMLLVVFVTDEDDCSAFDRAVFDASQDDRDSPLGELSSFRCFEFGVTCDQPDARVLGERTGCRPRVDSPYLNHPDVYAELLRDLKRGPGLVTVAAITGNPGSVEVIDDTSKNPVELSVKNLCPDEVSFPPSGAYPAVRIHALLDALPHHAASSICDQDMAGHLAGIAESTAFAMTGSRCLWATPHDGDDDRAGIQPVCRARLRLQNGEWTDLPACEEDAGGESCFEVREDRELCGATDSRLAIQVNGLALPEERVRLECLRRAD